MREPRRAADQRPQRTLRDISTITNPNSGQRANLQSIIRSSKKERRREKQREERGVRTRTKAASVILHREKLISLILGAAFRIRMTSESTSCMQPTKFELDLLFLSRFFACFSCCFVLFCFVLFCFVLFCFVLFCFVLFCFVLFCFVLFCFVLFCFVLFCFVLFWFVLFWFLYLPCLS